MILAAILRFLSTLFMFPVAEIRPVEAPRGYRCICGHDEADHVNRDTWCRGDCGCSFFESRPEWLDEGVTA